MKARVSARIGDGQYRPALERGLTIRRMAEHTGDTTLIQLLVHVAVDAMAQKALQNTLSAMPPDAPTPAWLAGELTAVPAGPGFFSA